MIGDERGDVRISPDQAIKLMAIAEMLQEGGIDIRGYEEVDVNNARLAIADVAQEIALQVHHVGDEHGRA